MIDRVTFARRLCEAEHPFNPRGTPCGSHLTQADYLIVLTTEKGDKALALIQEVRAEQSGFVVIGRIGSNFTETEQATWEDIQRIAAERGIDAAHLEPHG